ncbi:MAG: hypothetical protein KGL40_05725 [Rhodocyclaceae bacterium]|nr:hypothetical protein [Rhodocyclaceae bacterium]
MPNKEPYDSDKDEDSPQYQPGASQYRPQTVESDDEANREIASEYDDRIDPEMSDGDIETENTDEDVPIERVSPSK